MVLIGPFVLIVVTKGMFLFHVVVCEIDYCSGEVFLYMVGIFYFIAGTLNQSYFPKDV